MSTEDPPDWLDFGVGGFTSFGKRIADERGDRLRNAPHVLSFGVKYLDAALGGIFRNDLILLGARTGAGKTELASLIALHNAKKGARVHYFALEAEEREIERRSKYRALVNIIYDRRPPREVTERLNYLDWYMGRLEDLTEQYENAVNEVLGNAYANLYTYYRAKDFTAEQFERHVLAIQDQTDLVILDHLHYVDSEDANENRGTKIIVKKIRDVALSVGKPVIVVAHVRKAERKGAALVPTVEDFHGTSDIPKIATKAIMIAPAHDQPSGQPYLWPTYVSAAKCRPEGSRTRFVGLTLFNVRTNSYEPNYELGRLISNGEQFQYITDDSQKPYWARERK